MKRISFLFVAAVALVASGGCGCCSWCLPKPQPVATCAPACPPPACDPCATAPVTYGTAPAPVAPYTPPPQW